MELFKNLSGTFITHIPYRGAGPALNDTVAGQVPIIFDNMPSALPFIKDGRLVADRRRRAAAAGGAAERADLQGSRPRAGQPAWPTTASTVPRACPRRWSTRSHAAVKKALEDPAVRKRIEDTGSLIVANTPAAVRRADQGRVRGLQEGGGGAEADARVRRRGEARPGLAIASMSTGSAATIDRFIDALWIEDGLAPNTLAAYRRDLALLARLAAPERGAARSTRRARPTCATTRSRATPAARATSANRRLTVFKRYYRWALREHLIERRPDAAPGAARQPLRVPKSADRGAGRGVARRARRRDAARPARPHDARADVRERTARQRAGGA